MYLLRVKWHLTCANISPRCKNLLHFLRNYLHWAFNLLDFSTWWLIYIKIRFSGSNLRVWESKSSDIYQWPLEKKLDTCGAFKNHVDKEGWVGGQPNVHGCPRGVGRWSLLCPLGHFVLYFINLLLLFPRGPKLHQ